MNRNFKQVIALISDRLTLDKKAFRLKSNSNGGKFFVRSKGRLYTIEVYMRHTYKGRQEGVGTPVPSISDVEFFFESDWKDLTRKEG